MQKIIINKKYYGKIALPEGTKAWRQFNTIKNAFADKKPMNLFLLFGKKQLQSLQHYQKGGSWEELESLAMYIAMGEILGFDTQDARKLKSDIEQINDMAHTHYNIGKRLTLANRDTVAASTAKYIFWDIENFANIPAMFNHLIDKYDIPDEHIYLAANPDSLYIYKRAWESELYDYGKTLYSFNFTKCDHGKNVADDLLLDAFKGLELQQSDIYVMTYDRELKERFINACHQSNNLYIMSA